MTWLDLDLGQGLTVGMVMLGVLIVVVGAAAWFRGRRRGWRSWQPPEQR